MTLLEEIQLKDASRRAEVSLLGDVRRVIYSRADRITSAPVVSHGLGVFASESPSDAGEGIVFRGRAGRTPPTADAGVEIDYRPTSAGLFSSFFVGWKGEPFWWRKFSSAEGVTLNEMFTTLLAQVRRELPPSHHGMVFVEVLALLAPADIHDRALQKPVSDGDVLTTDDEHAPQYFKPHVILGDFKRRGASLEQSIPLCIAGVGADSGAGADAGFERLCGLAFYDAPGKGGGDSGSEGEGRARTHSHAFGWREQPALAHSLAAIFEAEDCGRELAALEEEILPAALERAPDYVVHVDDWTVMRAALVKVFVTELSRIKVQTVG